MPTLYSFAVLLEHFREKMTMKEEAHAYSEFIRNSVGAPRFFLILQKKEHETLNLAPFSAHYSPSSVFLGAE